MYSEKARVSYKYSETTGSRGSSSKSRVEFSNLSKVRMRPEREKLERIVPKGSAERKIIGEKGT